MHYVNEGPHKDRSIHVWVCVREREHEKLCECMNVSVHMCVCAPLCQFSILNGTKSSIEQS